MWRKFLGTNYHWTSCGRDGAVVGVALDEDEGLVCHISFVEDEAP